MLDQYGLWTVSQILGYGALFLGFGESVVLRVILVIAGCVSLLAGTLALCKEVEFRFSVRGHRALLAGPFVGGMFSALHLFKLVRDAADEGSGLIALLIYVPILITAVVQIVKRNWVEKMHD